MPGVIANASTLINLAAIGHLSLLKEFHTMIAIPTAVWQEVVDEGAGKPGCQEVEAAQQAGWLEVLEPHNRELVTLLEQQVDRGEAEAIALGIERQADLVFLDESDARNLAEVYRLSKSGVIGILIRAKLLKVIPLLKPELDRLREEAGFWIDEALYKRALQEVGEFGHESASSSL